MPAYGYSPQGVNLNRQFTGTARWVPELNALRETDPQAYAEIERRADEIWSGYTENELYSKTMEGGTGQRWEREAKSRAFFQAFEEYKKIPQMVTRTDKPMPIDAPYGQATEKAIEQVMRSMGLTRAEAIRYLSQNASDPEVQGELGALGKMAGVYRERPSAVSSETLSKATGERAAGQQPTEAEGIDSPTSPIVEQSNQPNLAPGEERVTEDAAPQDEVDPITGMAQLMSGGQTVYGKPVTEISRGENVAGILQALASAGQTYFGGRDIKAADKRERQGTASANLINALAGNIVAQAPRVTPSPGVATSMSKGLAKASSEFVRRREKQRALDQSAMMTKLTGQKGPTGKDPDSLTAAFLEDGARVGRSWGDKPESEFYDNNTVKSQKNLSANLIRRLMQVPPNLREGLIGSFWKGYRTAREKGADTKVADRVSRRRRRTELITNANAFGTANASGIGGSSFQDFVDQYRAEGAQGLSDDEILAAKGAYLKGRMEQSAKQAYKFDDDQFATDAEAAATLGVAGNERHSFWDYLSENPQIATYFQEGKGSGISLTTLKKRWDAQWQEQETARIKDSQLPNAVQAELLDLKTGEQEMLNLESHYAKIELKGPILGRLPAWQYFTPKKASYEKIISGFTVKLAAIINQGRPSDKDAEAIRHLLPQGAETDVVAADLFKNLKNIMALKRQAIEAAFDLPIWDYVRVDENGVGQVDAGKYEAHLRGRVLTQVSVNGMLDQLNGTRNRADEIEPPASGEAKAKLLKTFQDARVQVAQDENGVYVDVTPPEESNVMPSGVANELGFSVEDFQGDITPVTSGGGS